MLIGLSGFSLLGVSGYQIITYFLYIYFLQEKYFSFCYYKTAYKHGQLLVLLGVPGFLNIFYLSYKIWECYVYNFLDVRNLKIKIDVQDRMCIHYTYYFIFYVVVVYLSHSHWFLNVQITLYPFTLASHLR